MLRAKGERRDISYVLVLSFILDIIFNFGTLCLMSRPSINLRTNRARRASSLPTNFSLFNFYRIIPPTTLTISIKRLRLKRTLQLRHIAQSIGTRLFKFSSDTKPFSMQFSTQWTGVAVTEPWFAADCKVG
jgi:hypothetical protein